MIIQTMDSSLAPSSPTVNRTRSGRVTKAPDRYEPTEQVEDDYAPDDYDSNDPTDVSSDTETDSDEEDDESDADEDGNLDGFIVPDKNDSDCESTDGKPPVPAKKRFAKRSPVARGATGSGRGVAPAGSRRSSRSGSS